MILKREDLDKKIQDIRGKNKLRPSGNGSAANIKNAKDLGTAISIEDALLEALLHDFPEEVTNLSLRLTHYALAKRIVAIKTEDEFMDEESMMLKEKISKYFNKEILGGIISVIQPNLIK